MPKSWLRCSTNMSHSSNVPSSSSSSRRSRAVSLPLACCASMRFWPPPRRARARLASSCWMMSCMGRSLASRIGGRRHRPQVVGAAAKAPSSRRAATDTGRRPASTAASVASSCARTSAMGAKGVAQAGVDALPEPGQRLARRRSAARRRSLLRRRGTPRRRARPPRPAPASSALVASTRGCPAPCVGDAPTRCSADSIWPTARAAAPASRSALLTTTRSASSITPFLIACRSSPAFGSCSSTNMSVMPATAASLWPTPTVSTMTTS